MHAVYGRRLSALLAVARSTTYTSRPAAAGDQDCDYVGADLNLQRVRCRRSLAAPGFAARSIAGTGQGGFVRHDNRGSSRTVGAVDRTRDRVFDELWADDRAFVAVPPAVVPLVSSR
jgi:hypothetical protein